jgi:DNA-binding NarL/FixJ family response regulator
MAASAPTRLRIVEAAYRLDLSEREHIAELARIAVPGMARRGDVAAFVVDRPPGKSEFQIDVMTSTDERLADAVQRAARGIPAQVHADIAASAPMFTTCSQLLGQGQWTQLSPVTGLSEFACLLCPIGSATVTIGTRRRAAVAAGVAERRHWAPVAAHVSAAWRLRRTIQQLDSVTFSTDGTPREQGLGAPLSLTLRAQLRRAILQREALRVRRSEDLWPALIAGEWALVDRFESSGRRVVVAHRTDALARPLQALTRREAQALQLALCGVANKVVALELRVSESTVSRLVERALRRLDLGSLAEAAELRSMAHSTLSLSSGSAHGGSWNAELAVLEGELANGSPSLSGQVPLTRAERSVLAAVLAGQSHQQIATDRRTSRRTVDNQVASIFGKLRVNSRRELVARVLFVSPSVLPPTDAAS